MLEPCKFKNFLNKHNLYIQFNSVTFLTPPRQIQCKSVFVTLIRM